MKHEDPSSWEGRADRKPVDLRGFALAEGVDADILVSDLSYEGCQVQSDHRFELGDRLELRIIGRGGIFAEVRWIADDRAGLRFVAQP